MNTVHLCAATGIHALLASLIMLLMSCNVKESNSSGIPNPILCSEIVMNDDGGETKLEFDKQGRLLTLWGKSIADFYTNSVPWRFSVCAPDEKTTIELRHHSDQWLFSSLDDTKKNGSISNFRLKPGGNKNKVYHVWIKGLSNGGTATYTNTFYDYDAHGDCTNWQGRESISGQKAAIVKGTARYQANRPSPFAGTPFQWLIETNWSAGGHTNNYLTESEDITISNEGLDDTHRIISRIRVIYSYQYDKNGRITRIQIDKQKNHKVTNQVTGQVAASNSKTQKVIRFTYICSQPLTSHAEELPFFTTNYPENQ
jgi:hypothetical protein